MKRLVLFVIQKLNVVVLSALIIQQPSQAADAPHQKPPIPIIIDVSGSMAGRKIDAAKEGAKLAIAILDSQHEVVIVDFNDTARRAPFSLKTPRDRQAAQARVQSLIADGGTNYIAGLRAAAVSRDTAAIFLSDGEHNGPPEQVLDYLKANPSGPLYTVAVDAPPPAAKLLADMAARSGGSFVAVDRSEDVVRAFVEIAKSLSHYRSYKPQEDTIRCRAAAGRILAFGFDAAPVITGAGSLNKAVYEHEARLPGEQVRLTAIDLSSATDLVIKATQKRSQHGRLGAVLRQDLIRAKMDVLAPGGKAAAGSDLRVTTVLTDTNGMAVDPRRRADLSSVFHLFDQAGKLLQKVTAKPSATEPVMEATLRLPKQQGPVTIKNVTTDASTGLAFEAEDSRTVIVQQPMPLSVDPAQISLSGKEGSFTTTLKLKAPSVDLSQTVVSARLEGADNALRLVQAQANGDILTLNLEVTRPGTYRAALLVQATADVPLEVVRVPLGVTVSRPVLGLSLPPSRELALGPVVANSGNKQIVTLSIPSLDAEATDYTLDIDDLSDGSAVIPLRADATKLQPTKDRPARVTLTADIGNVPSGEYRGTAVVRLGTSGSGKEWKTKLTLSVSEPLTVESLDFGKVEVGRVAKGMLRIKNAGEALQDIRLDKVIIKAKDNDVIVTCPDKVAVLAARQQKEIAISLAVSPLAESRGRLHGTVIVRRAAGQELSVPIDVEIVGAGEGLTALRASPGKVQLVAKPQEVRQFDIRIKYAADAAPNAGEELQAEAGVFKDPAGRPSSIEVAFKWSTGSRLTAGTPVTLQGFFIAPMRPGLYTGSVTVRSTVSGNATVPVSVDVQ